MKKEIDNQWLIDNMQPMTEHEKEIAAAWEPDPLNPYNKDYCMQPPVHCRECSLVTYGLDCHNNHNNLLRRLQND